MPIKKIIGKKTIISNNAVPRSGCLIIKTTGYDAFCSILKQLLTENVHARGQLHSDELLWLYQRFSYIFNG